METILSHSMNMFLVKVNLYLGALPLILCTNVLPLLAVWTIYDESNTKVRGPTSNPPRELDAITRSSLNMFWWK